ncbi:MAG: hypothetical protein IJM14_03400 [Lachnospiraceae bacterium]|nr:hypothetical protein [Lachnospiraceae bacterium]
MSTCQKLFGQCGTNSGTILTSIRTLLTHFGTAFSIYKVVHDPDTGKTDTVLNAEQVRAELGENLTDALLKYFNSLKNVTELQYRRQKEIDNGLATVNFPINKKSKRLKNYEIVKSYPGGEKLPGRGNNAPGKA